jgi:hypothetical protein
MAACAEALARRSSLLLLELLLLLRRLGQVEHRRLDDVIADLLE